MKIYLRFIFCLAFYYSGTFSLILSWKKWRRKEGATLFMFHRVSNGVFFGLPTISITKENFQLFLNFINGHYKIISFENCLDANIRGAASITFDDGYQEILENAWPILSKYNFPSISFIPTDFPGSGRHFWWDIFYVLFSSDDFKVLDEIDEMPLSLKHSLIQHKGKEREQILISAIQQVQSWSEEKVTKLHAQVQRIYEKYFKSKYPIPPILSWNEIIKLSKHEMIMASHSESHRVLPLMHGRDLEMEVMRSKVILEEKIGKKVHFFCYPAGKFNEQTVDIVKRAGYLAAVTTQEGQNVKDTDPFLLKRINVWDGLVVCPWGKFSKATTAWNLTLAFWK